MSITASGGYSREQELEVALEAQQDRAIELGLRNTDLLHEVVRLREVLQAVTEVYEGLISSGDCGPKIDPDTDPLAIQARAALNLKGQA